MQEPFVILCCENIRPEVDAVLATGAMPHAVAESFPFHCGHVQSVWKTVKNQYDEHEKAGASTCLCGCGCANTIDIQMDVKNRPSLVLVESGAPLFLPGALVEDFRRRGVYLILPGWLFRWKQNAARDGLDQSTAREMFKESLQEIVLLDTGVHPGFAPDLAEFADFTGIPARTIPVGIDYFRLRLLERYLQWENEQEISSCKMAVTAAEKRVADYSMVADLPGRLIGIHDERAAIRQMLDMIIMISCPKTIGFLPVFAAGHGEIISIPPDAYTSTTHFHQVFNPEKQYLISKSGDRFLFQVRDNESLIGILSVDGVSIPAALDEYVNLTHFISQIAGLSIKIARAHSDLKLAMKAREMEIAERIRTELALSESEENYRTLVESSFDGIAIHQGGILVYVNHTAARLLGSEDPGDFTGKPAINIVAPAFRERVVERVQQAPDRGLDLVREQFLRLDGTLIDVEVTTAPSIWKGRPAAYVTFRDITAQVQAEQALRDSEERYRTIIENIQDVFFRFDGENRLVLASPSAAHTFGYASPEDMIGIPGLSIWKNPEQWNHFLEAMRNEEGAVQDWEAEFVKKDGTVFWASVSAHLHPDGQGNSAGTEGIIRDISERKKIEDALKGAVKKLNMLSSITRHDILNQIMGLRTFLELSREDLKGTKYEPFIKKEDEAAEAIQRQIEFTKYYQDIGVNAPKWQDAEAVIREAVIQLNPPSIDVQVAVTALEIFADPLIVKVFFNLMENSLRHGERVTMMSFTSRGSGTGLVITYQDNGVGITADDKQKLFRKGFGKHTGLGLFLSREILAITNITVIENGEPGKGVRFEITVPEEGYRFVKPG
jgi:PAS domain S-box-containing protein